MSAQGEGTSKSLEIVALQRTEGREAAALYYLILGNDIPRESWKLLGYINGMTVYLTGTAARQ